MNAIINEVVKILRQLHGEPLNLQDDYYQLILPDGIITLYLDDEEKTIKIECNFIENAKVYKTDVTSLIALLERNEQHG